MITITCPDPIHLSMVKKLEPGYYLFSIGREGWQTSIIHISERNQDITMIETEHLYSLREIQESWPEAKITPITFPLL